MKIGAICFAAFCTFSYTVSAEEIKVERLQPALGLPLYDYTITNCDGLRGFGELYYSKDNATKSISDVCILEEEGRVLGPEPLASLELTKKSRNGRSFEDLASGDSQYDRNSITILLDEVVPSCAHEEVESFVLVRKDSPVSNKAAAGTAFMRGYTIPATAPDPLAPTSKVFFGLRNISRGRIDSGHANIASFKSANNDNGDFVGTAEFSGNGGTITLLQGGGNRFGDVSGTLSVQFDGLGGVILNGAFDAQNTRMVGFEPGEFKNLSGELVHFRGHVLGSDGAEMVGYGLAKGTVIDESDQTHDFLAIAYLISCLSEDN